MKKDFINNDFLLQTKFAKKLYHKYAKNLPIIDYHCHLSPEQIATNYQFENISEVWLFGDHYKWRAMRTLGISEDFITGNASPEEKFNQWAKAVPQTMRNPLYHWTHLELKRYFGVNELLTEKNASKIYNTTTSKIQNKNFSTQGLLKKMNVEVVCTTDDPIDDLKYHKNHALKNQFTKLLPTFRPDKVYNLSDLESFNAYINSLSEVANVKITNYKLLLKVLQNRIDYFAEIGAKLSDHGIESLYYFEVGTFDCDSILKKAFKNDSISEEEKKYFQFETLLHLFRMYHAKNWTQQLHLGALRNNNQRMLSNLGPDTGFDSIGDFSQAKALSHFLNQLDSTNQLSKTIIYNLNPADNEVMATMIGNFNDGSCVGKIQFGSAWWFLDQKDGMEKQLNTLSNFGVLSTFIGMLTDSRSFLSFPRHEYFRRILCNLIGNDVKNGLLPNDEKLLGKIISNICYYNAKDYFKF